MLIEYYANLRGLRAIHTCPSLSLDKLNCGHHNKKKKMKKGKEHRHQLRVYAVRTRASGNDGLLMKLLQLLQIIAVHYGARWQVIPISTDHHHFVRNGSLR